MTELQVRAGLGFCLQVLQLLWIKVQAVITLIVFQEADDKVRGRVDKHFNFEIDSSGKMVVGGEGHTLLDWPGRFWLRKESAM